MAQPVVAGALLTCSMGMVPAPLRVLPSNRVTIEGKPAANIMDNTMANVGPFGLCNSLPEPITAAQTAAALGVLTPGACIPTFPAPWIPGSPTVLVGGLPAVTSTCQLICAFGGVVQVTFAGTVRETMP